MVPKMGIELASCLGCCTGYFVFRISHVLLAWSFPRPARCGLVITRRRSPFKLRLFTLALNRRNPLLMPAVWHSTITEFSTSNTPVVAHSLGANEMFAKRWLPPKKRGVLVLRSKYPKAFPRTRITVISFLPLDFWFHTCQLALRTVWKSALQSEAARDNRIGSGIAIGSSCSNMLEWFAITI